MLQATTAARLQSTGTEGVQAMRCAPKICSIILRSTDTLPEAHCYGRNAVDFIANEIGRRAQSRRRVAATSQGRWRAFHMLASPSASYRTIINSLCLDSLNSNEGHSFSSQQGPPNPLLTALVFAIVHRHRRPCMVGKRSTKAFQRPLPRPERTNLEFATSVSAKIPLASRQLLRPAFPEASRPTKLARRSPQLAKPNEFWT